MTSSVSEKLLAVDDLKVWYPGNQPASFGKPPAPVKAVDGVSFQVGRGETLGLVGESGCGKSTISRALMRLSQPTHGQAKLGGTDIATAAGSELKDIRRRMSMVFQDPFGSFNPRRSIRESIAEPMIVHKIAPNQKARDHRVAELMDMVELSETLADRYPHEISGGQRQRAAIARALASNPDLIICDEAVSSLDVSVQAAILNLLRSLQQELGLSYLFIAHDLAAVTYVSHRIAVMYLGRIVEQADTANIRDHASHPYTKALLSSVRLTDPDIERNRSRIVLAGEVPDPSAPPSGCRFRTRCPFAFDRCSVDDPQLQMVGSNAVACHLFDTDNPPSTSTVDLAPEGKSA